MTYLYLNKAIFSKTCCSSYILYDVDKKRQMWDHISWGNIYPIVIDTTKAYGRGINVKCMGDFVFFRTVKCIEILKKFDKVLFSVHLFRSRCLISYGVLFEKS